jgi:hypothetical protein
MARILRNGQAYSAGDVIVTIRGMSDVNPSAIEYSYTYSHEREMGLKRKPRAWRMGGVEYSCNITLSMDVITELERMCPPGTDLAMLKPFPIIVVYLSSENEEITDIITAKFQGAGRSISNDGAIEYQFEMFVTDMELNV